MTSNPTAQGGACPADVADICEKRAVFFWAWEYVNYVVDWSVPVLADIWILSSDHNQYESEAKRS